MQRTLLVVSARAHRRAASTLGPRKDYTVLAHALDADILDHDDVEASRVGRLMQRLFGMQVAQAWLAFRRRAAYSAIVTDGEHVGIPLAFLLLLARARVPHVTIGHRLAAPKKQVFFRWLKLHHNMNRIALHSMRQHELSRDALGIPDHQLALVPYQVDTDFWQPQPRVGDERMICSAGLEFRDYPTLFKAIDGLDVRAVVGAASHWSKRRNTAQGAATGTNVEIASFDYFGLRDLYARAAIVVVPLEDVDFQAGVTTILEAMAMGKPVIVTHSQGQTDVVEDSRAMTRGNPPRKRPTSFTRQLGNEHGHPVDPTGFYVPPADPAALRKAIVYLLDHPEERKRLGAAGRRTVEGMYTVDQFGERIRALVDDARLAAGSKPQPAALVGVR
jgi:glycosyltransferase involved in cell wall biosynthesis